MMGRANIWRHEGIASAKDKRARSLRRVLLQNARSLANGQSDAWPMLCHALEDAPGLIEAGPREHEVDHTHPVFAPLLDLVEVAPIGVDRIIGLFVGPVAHYAARATIRGFMQPAPLARAVRRAMLILSFC